MKYCQCTLERVVSTGSSTSLSQIVSYIPVTFAKLGDTVKIMDGAGNWQDGYVVKTVGPKVEEELLPDRHDQIKAHRRATGDALPKRGS